MVVVYPALVPKMVKLRSRAATEGRPNHVRQTSADSENIESLRDFHHYNFAFASSPSSTIPSSIALIDSARILL
jgi:hypothetical protein